MPKVRIPLVGSFTQRWLDASGSLDATQDQRFLNCVFSVIKNPVTGKTAVYVEKRPGFKQDSLVAASNVSTGLIRPQAFNATISAFGATNSTIYFGTSSVGTITGRALHFMETLISNVSHVMIRSSDGTGWYYVDGARDVTAYTCDGNNSTTITDIKVSGVNSVSGLYVGQKLTAASNGLAGGARIVSINAGAFSAVLDTATTGGAFNDLAITKEPIAKIIDADFVTAGSYITAFVEMDGYLFYGASNTGYIWNSDLNSVTSYDAANFQAAQMSPDPLVAMVRHRNAVVAIGGQSKEIFYNGGNAVGSPLTRAAQYFQHIGVQDQRSVTYLDDEVYFLSTPSEGDVGVYKIEEWQAQRISPPIVDKIIGSSVASGGQCYASAFRLGGNRYLTLYISSASDSSGKLLLSSGDYLLQYDNASFFLLSGDNTSTATYVTTIVCNLDLNVWSEWNCPVATFIQGVGQGFTNRILASSRSVDDGKVYTINPASDGQTYTDDGDTITTQIRTGKVDLGTSNRIFWKSCTLICDEQSSGTVTLEVNDNDFDTDDWVTVGTFDLTQKRNRLYRLGSSVHPRAYRLTHTDNAMFRAEALEFEFEVASA